MKLAPNSNLDPRVFFVSVAGGSVCSRLFQASGVNGVGHGVLGEKHFSTGVVGNGNKSKELGKTTFDEALFTLDLIGIFSEQFVCFTYSMLSSHPPPGTIDLFKFLSDMSILFALFCSLAEGTNLSDFKSLFVEKSSNDPITHLRSFKHTVSSKGKDLNFFFDIESREKCLFSSVLCFDKYLSRTLMCMLSIDPQPLIVLSSGLLEWQSFKHCFL